MRIWARLLRYGIAGLFATIVYFAVVAALVEAASVDPVIAAAVSTALTVALSYAMNRAWVFDTDRSHASAVSRFLAASAFSGVLNIGLMYLVVHGLRWPYVAGLVLATVVVPPTNFTVNYLWCFRPAADRQRGIP